MSKMDLVKMFEIQKMLDAKIEKEHPTLEGEYRLGKKILAFQVELGELANELPRTFKFWSNKKNDYKKALVEYVDSLHFIFSIGLELGINGKGLENHHTGNPYDITDTFREVFASVSRPLNLYSIDTKHEWFEEVLAWLLDLGEKLGFTGEQIEHAYLSKNQINHERQNNGY